MKKLLISSALIVALGFAGMAQADRYRGHGTPPGIQKQLDRGRVLSSGHQKKILRVEHRRYYHDSHRDNHHKYHHDRRRYNKNSRYYRSKPKHYDYPGGYHSFLRYHDGISGEERAARIIRDTRILIDQSR